MLLWCAREQLDAYLAPDGVGHNASRYVVAEELGRDGAKWGAHPKHSASRLQSRLSSLLLGLWGSSCPCATEHCNPGEEGLPSL